MFPLLAVVSILCWLSGKLISGTLHSPKLLENHRFADVFNGFQYAGAYSCADFQVPSHEVRLEPFPERFWAKKCYVFHLPAAVSVNTPELFIRRLRQNGVELVRYPRTETDLVYPAEGGPLFRIDFCNEGRSGSILALQGMHAAQHADVWQPDDYILWFARKR